MSQILKIQLFTSFVHFVLKNLLFLNLHLNFSFHQKLSFAMKFMKMNFLHAKYIPCDQQTIKFYLFCLNLINNFHLCHLLSLLLLKRKFQDFTKNQFISYQNFYLKTIILEIIRQFNLYHLPQIHLFSNYLFLSTNYFITFLYYSIQNFQRYHHLFWEYPKLKLCFFKNLVLKYLTYLILEKQYSVYHLMILEKY